MWWKIRSGRDSASGGCHTSACPAQTPLHPELERILSPLPSRIVWEQHCPLPVNSIHAVQLANLFLGTEPRVFLAYNPTPCIDGWGQAGHVSGAASVRLECGSVGVGGAWDTHASEKAEILMIRIISNVRHPLGGGDIVKMLYEAKEN